MPTDEENRIHDQRFDHALKLGYSILDADEIAGDKTIDVHDLEMMIYTKGCKNIDLALEIVR